jgi:hypothetical protein
MLKPTLLVEAASASFDVAVTSDGLMVATPP